MNRCKTCTHWTPVNPAEWGALRGAGECTAVRAMHDVTERHEDERGEYLALEPEHAALLAVVADGSGYKAELITMPDFGCVQHEQMVDFCEALAPTDVPMPEDLMPIDEAMRYAELWAAGKMIGGDVDAVCSSLYAEVLRLRPTSPPTPQP